MHDHSLNLGIALAGLVVAIAALIFQVMAFRRDK